MLIFLSSEKGKALLGGFELSSSMFYLRDRDTYLGWRGLRVEERARELRQAADLSLYFSTPEFGALRGSKFVALCSLASEVRREFEKRYGDQLKVVSSICATGNHSAVLNRLGFGEEKFKKVGCTGPTSVSHISRETVQAARALCNRSADAFADSNARSLNTIADAIRIAGLSRDQYIDVAPPRAIYVARFMAGAPASVAELFSFWKERWMLR